MAPYSDDCRKSMGQMLFKGCVTVKTLLEAGNTTTILLICACGATDDPAWDDQINILRIAGDSWKGEYGDPDKPEEREYILKYSPYQNVKSGVNYPTVFFTTSTKDDRVHPGHARKMAARLLDLKQPVFYWENTQGGHRGAAGIDQQIMYECIHLHIFANTTRFGKMIVLNIDACNTPRSCYGTSVS